MMTNEQQKFPVVINERIMSQLPVVRSGATYQNINDYIHTISLSEMICEYHAAGWHITSIHAGVSTNTGGFGFDPIKYILRVAIVFQDDGDSVQTAILKAGLISENIEPLREWLYN